MKFTKKICAVFLSAMLILMLFAGCSAGSEVAEEITGDTMLIAYTEECAPFIYTNESGKLAGFDVELIENTFDSFKGEYKNYRFIQVEEGYKLGEDTAYTDENGNEYSAVILCGGMHKNVGTVNEDYNWSQNIIENNIITVVPASSTITSYSNIDAARVGIYPDSAAAALNSNTAVAGRLSEAIGYTSIEEAFAALDAGELDAVVTDSFSFYTYENNTSYTALNGALDTIEYGFAFAKNNDLSSGFNEAVKEMLSPDYGDGDTLTPIVEKHFGYNGVCVFTYEDEQK